MKLKLNISPCPNDTFMFDALINGRIDTEGLEFEVAWHDIEQLNLRALRREAHITKISCAILPLIVQDYGLLDAGSALGRGNGPLLVAGSGSPEVFPADDPRTRIAVPGVHTTANLLMEKLFPHLGDKTEVLFSEIAGRVAAGEFDGGVLIHEGRFTYRDKGLGMVCDLGTEWEKRTGLPLPLGAIAASRALPRQTIAAVERVLRRSIEYAMADPGASREFVAGHAREMDEGVIASHIALFVNDFSLSLGSEGLRAVSMLTGLDNRVMI